MNLSQYALNNGGFIRPLILPSNLTGGTGLMNPSIFIDDKIRLIIRHVNYTFYHSEKKLFQHYWGPLTYVHPENDMHLRTINYYCELDEQYNISRYHKIDTSKFDTYEPLWDFVGLEDARIFRWNGRLYTSGVRRDLDSIGTARMELCEIQVNEDSVVETSRFRIPPPKDPTSYCEKNWMPILDKPFHYIKWTNPTEVVKVDPDTKTSETVFLSDKIFLNKDIRGGSQIMRLGDFYLACTHEVDLFNSETGRKDGVYRHRFILWDKDFNVAKFSSDFDFMDGHVEFCIGIARHRDNVLFTFGFQDNAAYILGLPIKSLEKYINENS